MSTAGPTDAGSDDVADELVVDGVTVTPGTFRLVDFDAESIARLTRDLARTVGLGDDVAIRIAVDETTPLGNAEVASIEPLVVKLESGALEDPLKPRQLSIERSQDMIGRLLMRVRDRLDPAFGDPPSDLDLDYPSSVAWDIYAVGRLARLGLPTHRERRRYHFRLRHGFSDRADQIFDQLWQADGLTWADVERLSTDALTPIPTA